MEELSDLEMVSGNECLQYIDKPIAFACHGRKDVGETIGDSARSSINYIQKDPDRTALRTFGSIHQTVVEKWEHDTTKKKIGLITKRYDDGGYEVAILSDDAIDTTSTGNFTWTQTRLVFGQSMSYTANLFDNTVTRDNIMTSFPVVNQYGGVINYAGIPAYSLFINTRNISLPFDETLNVNPNENWIQTSGSFALVWTRGGTPLNEISQTVYTLTNDKSTTLTFGTGITADTPTEYPKIYMDNPLQIFAGDFYQYACDQAVKSGSYFLPQFLDVQLFSLYTAGWDNEDISSTNLTSVPYNIILTNDEQQAQKYLRDGTLPSDAFLFPLDFDNLPTYQSDDSSDEDDDDGQGDLDDDSRDCDSDLPEVPTYTPNSLNTNNVYLLTVGEVNQIINWLWNDVGSVQDLDDLVTKIQGLTSDLIQNFLMFRVMPVKPAWIGGAGSSTNFVVGSVEKAGEYMNLAKGNPPIVNIGSYHFGDKFNTFKFLNYSPYSDFKLYLPYHGFVDIDVSVFQGHSLDVKAVYDYMTGTITYMIYSDNTWLVNTYTAKMAVDLSVSLQTKNDRDSAIFGNVSNAVAGVMSAGASVASGNPIGLIMGAQALVQQTHSAPFKAMGQVGEMGAFYTPQRCKVLIRRPVPTTPETYNQNVGRQAYYSTTLAKLKGKGYTKCINPRLKFTKTIPLADEEEKINQLLSEGVYL